MARYRYAGPGPVTGDDGAIVRPGDVRELASCAWGPWELIDDSDETPREPARAAPSPAPAETPDGPAAAGSAAKEA